jgi:hypothetical protein
MGNHFHLVVETPNGNLVEPIRSLLRTWPGTAGAGGGQGRKDRG